mgnify:CR=1 FL=1
MVLCVSEQNLLCIHFCSICCLQDTRNYGISLSEGEHPATIHAGKTTICAKWLLPAHSCAMVPSAIWVVTGNHETLPGMNDLGEHKIKFIEKSNRLMKDNTREVQAYNTFMLFRELVVLSCLEMIPLAASLFRSSSSPFVISLYAVTLTVSVTLMILTKKVNNANHVIFCLYAGFTMVFVQGISLSVIGYPIQSASILLGIFCVMPICFIDDIRRIALFESSFYLLSMVFAYRFKPLQLLLDEGVNCFCCMAFGLFLGAMIQRTKLESFELEKTLKKERETDALTGLKNRWKLSEVLSNGDHGYAAFDGVFMIDVDHFKRYNDRYGHEAGDLYLHRLGALFLKIEAEDNISFFRYGGEEFVAFLHAQGAGDVSRMAEKMRMRVERLAFSCGGQTVSIGFVVIPGEGDNDLEKAINQADKAMYQAKKTGRNRAVPFTEVVEYQVSRNGNPQEETVLVDARMKMQ